MEKGEKGEGKKLPVPTPSQRAWQEAELGVLFHYDLSVFDGRRYHQPSNRLDGSRDVDLFSPDNLDVGQWIDVAVDLGARFAILTASHETGFRLWCSRVNPYSLSSTRWNARLGVLDYKVTDSSPVTQEEYNSLIEKEVEEVMGNYGPWFEAWFDGGASGPDDGAPDILPIFEKLQPGCLFYHNSQRADARWGGSESGTVAYPCWSTFPFKSPQHAMLHEWKGPAREFYKLLATGDPDGKFWCPAMADTPLRTHEWVWNPGDEKKIKSLGKLMEIYFKSVGRNATLIVGLTPGPDGLVPEADALRCKEWGEAIRSFRTGITHGEIFDDPGCERAARDEGWVLETFASRPFSFNIITIQEDIASGERVRKFHVDVLREGKSGGKWKKVAGGTCIGHKRIITLPRTIHGVVAARVRIPEAVAWPRLRSISFHDVGRSFPGMPPLNVCLGNLFKGRASS